MNTEFKAHGKLLLTGEYLILHGAQGLALPLTKKHQKLKVHDLNSPQIIWRALDEKNQLWFEVAFNLRLDILAQTSSVLALKLQTILLSIYEKKPELFTTGLSFETTMNFSSAWGFGSSSTLISLISQWSGINSYELQKEFFGGSGYDVACAVAQNPLLFKLVQGSPQVKEVSWDPPFKHHLYFLYLGQKKDSREAMEHFKLSTPSPSFELIKKMSNITDRFLGAQDLNSFQSIMIEHESLIAPLLNTAPIKNRLFSDFPGAVKSLGGWGGDFVLVATEQNPAHYFQNLGLTTLLKWTDLN